VFAPRAGWHAVGSPVAATGCCVHPTCWLLTCVFLKQYKKCCTPAFNVRFEKFSRCSQPNTFGAASCFQWVLLVSTTVWRGLFVSFSRIRSIVRVSAIFMLSAVQKYIVCVRKRLLMQNVSTHYATRPIRSAMNSWPRRNKINGTSAKSAAAARPSKRSNIDFGRMSTLLNVTPPTKAL